ncbi:MAG: hypothetical protein NTY53_24485 [Kiritimatiellaeota bacterium]|nr:hypothetical protein [Kiritimatiellota bacterium]
MGSIVETVVSSSVPGPTRSPICALERPARPSIGAHFREREIHGRLLDRGLVAEVGLQRVIEFLLAHGFFQRERLEAFHIQLVLAEPRLRLVERGLKGARINRKHRVAFFHERAFLIKLLREIAGHLRMHVRMHEPIERADPLTRYGHVLLQHFRDGDLRRRGRLCLRFDFASGQRS